MLKTGTVKPRTKGTGNITPNGYVRLKVNGKLIFEHRYVWELYHGKVPVGYEIHHKNHNKQDNRIENLELVDRVEHRRKHEGWQLINNEWHKRCPDCLRLLIVGTKNWYFSTINNKTIGAGKILFGNCRACHIRKVDDARKAKAA